MQILGYPDESIRSFGNKTFITHVQSEAEDICKSRSKDICEIIDGKCEFKGKTILKIILHNFLFTESFKLKKKVM